MRAYDLPRINGPQRPGNQKTACAVAIWDLKLTTEERRWQNKGPIWRSTRNWPCLGHGLHNQSSDSKNQAQSCNQQAIYRPKLPKYILQSSQHVQKTNVGIKSTDKESNRRKIDRKPNDFNRFWLRAKVNLQSHGAQKQKKLNQRHGQVAIWGEKERFKNGAEYPLVCGIRH
jgi:hypothetical protein